jgi:hypothetical protein
MLKLSIMIPKILYLNYPVLPYVRAFRFAIDADKPSIASNKDNHSQFIRFQRLSLTKELKAIQMNYERASKEITGVQTNVKPTQNRMHGHKEKQGMCRNVGTDHLVSIRNGPFSQKNNRARPSRDIIYSEHTKT